VTLQLSFRVVLNSSTPLRTQRPFGAEQILINLLNTVPGRHPEATIGDLRDESRNNAHLFIVSATFGIPTRERDNMPAHELHGF
jgi:hypothetical protein